MRNSACIISAFICFFLVLFCYAPRASAAEATRLYLELSSSSALMLPTSQGEDYLRGRVTLLDANNQLATTFNGAAIEDAEIVFQSAYGASAQFSLRPATDLDLSSSDWETAASTVTVSPEKAWQEFAVSYDSITLSGTDTITVTLKQGGDTLVDQRSVEVQGPQANCYVVRTGGGLNVGLYDDIPGQQNDRGNVKSSGDTTTVDVYAAFYYTDSSGTEHYVYTDNVPIAARSPSVGGTAFTLTNGHAQQSVSQETSANTGSASGFHESFSAGSSQTFSAGFDSEATRWVGNDGGDVTGDEYINVTQSSSLFDEAGSSDYKTDTSTYKAVGTVSRITIIGLPVNQVDEDGIHKESGFGAQEEDPGQLTPDPDDALKLLDDPTQKPTKFRVAGEEGQTYIYGAIVGFDANGDPAPFAQGVTATFYLGKGEGIPVNSAAPELYSISPTYSPSESGVNASGMITASFAYQWFLPFRIPATADDGSTPSIENLYISDIRLWNGSSYSSYSDASIYDNIDTPGEGVDFIAQDFINSIDVTDVANLNDKNAGDDAEIIITGTDDEPSFQMKVFDDGGGAVSIGYKDTTDELTWIGVPEDEDNTALQDVAFFTALNSKNLLFLVKGGINDTYANVYYGDGLTIVAADPDDFEPTSISSGYSEINVLLDDEQDHNTVAIRDGVISVKDIFSNSYGATGATLEDSKIQPSVLSLSDNGSVSETAFPGASSKVDGNSVEVKFSLDDITESRDSAVLRLSTPKGGASAEATLYMKNLDAVSLDNVFVPIPGIDDTPVAVRFIDQDGEQIAPVTVTAASAPGNDESEGNAIEVELSADNGTIGGDQTILLKTVSPRKVITADPGDNTRMSVSADTRNYGTDTLELVFEPDLTPPYVGDITTDNCQVAIEIIDNSDVDLQETEVSIKNSTGDDITAQLERTHIDNGTSGTIVFTGTPGQGFTEGENLAYTADITPKDAWQNERAAVERIFSLTCESGPEPLCLTVDPASGNTGDNMTITIIAQDSHFEQGLTEVSFSCDNETIAVQAVRVLSETELEVDIAIAGGDSGQSGGGDDNGTVIPSNGDEQTGTRVFVSSVAAQTSPTTTVPTTTTTVTPLEGSPCDISIATGDETVTCEGAFTVYDVSSGKCLGLVPSAVDSGASTTLFVTGEGLNFSALTPDQVNFDCDEIAVTGVSGSGNQLLVDITSNAVDETVTCIMTLSDDAIPCGEVTVKPMAADAACRLISISRQVVRAGRVLPRFYLVTIQGNGMCSFDSRPEVRFGADSITAQPFFWLGSTVVSVVRVNPKTTPYTYNVTVNGVGGVTLTVR